MTLANIILDAATLLSRQASADGREGLNREVAADTRGNPARAVCSVIPLPVLEAEQAAVLRRMFELSAEINVARLAEAEAKWSALRRSKAGVACEAVRGEWVLREVVQGEGRDA